MKCKLAFLALLMFVFARINFAQTTPVYVDDDYNSGTTGWGVDHFASITAGISGVTSGGTIYIAAGTYSYSATLTINKSVNLIGEDVATVIIDGTTATTLSNFIDITAANVSIQNVTVDGSVPQYTTWPPAKPFYGINISSAAPNNISFQNVIVKEFGKNGFNLNGASTISFLDVTSIDNGGAGFFMTDVHDISLENITTNNNQWGGICIATWGRYYTGGVDGVVFTGTNNFGESTGVQGGLYLEEGNFHDKANPYLISFSSNPADNANVTYLDTDFGYSLNGPQDDGDPVTSDGYLRIRLFNSEVHVSTAALTAYDAGNLSNPGHLLDEGRYIINLSDGSLYIPAGLDVQDALDAATPGNVINIESGTYPALSINVDNLTLNFNGAVINHGSPAITVSSTGVVINGAVFIYDADEYAIQVDAGAFDVLINNCVFQNTNGVGVPGKAVNNDGTGIIDTRNNYWYNATGPNYIINTGGTGSIASNNSTGSIIFYPWYTDAALTTLISLSPTLLTPVNASIGVTIVPSFQWTWPIGASTFTVEIATDAGFANIVYGPSTVTSPFQLPDVNALSNGMIYHWRITATSPGSVTSFSTGKFITISSAMPYMTNPSSGGILSGYTTTFAWYTGVAGIQYTLQICKDNLFTTNYIDSYGTVDFTPSPLYNNTYVTLNNTIFKQGVAYYWRVVAKTLSGVIINFSNTWQFSMPGLPLVNATYPASNVTIYNNPPTLYWYPEGYNPKVTEYVIKYRRSDQSYQAFPTTSGHLYGSFTTLSSNTFITIPAALDAGYRYYWQVASSDGSARSAYSSEESFTVYGSSTFVVCYPSYPTAGATVYSTTPTLYWYTNVYSPIMYYRVVIDNDSNLGSPLYQSTGLTIPSASFTVPSSAGLVNGTTYFWGIQASFDNTNWGSLSAPASFVVTSTGTAASVATATPASPTSGIVIGVTNPTLSWYVYSADPLQFRVTWATDPAVTGGTFTTAVGTSGWMTSNSFVLGSLTAGATYYWQVQTRLATTSVEGAWSTVAWFSINAGSASVVPLAGSPINGTPINTTNATLSWILPTQSTATLKYDVQYSKNPDFSNAVTISNLDKPNVELKNLDKDAVYYWRASSFTNTGKKSDYSAPTSFATGAVVTDIEEQEMIPTQFELSQNYPNPFNPTTKITYSLPQNSFVSIKVYDMLGREVRSLVNSEMLAGNHSIEWSGEDNAGSKVASGAYLYRITAGNYISTKKMVLIK